MGYRMAEARVYASLSNHNSDQDGLDRQAWREFIAEVQALMRKPEYDEIGLSLENRSDD